LTPPEGKSEQFEVSTMGSKWEIEGLSGEYFKLLKVKMEAILMFEMMDKS
jgi:hypothetical protein